MKDWPKDLKAAVGRIKTLKHNETAGDGKQETVVEVQLWDKPRALEMLFKHLGLLRERLEVDVSEGLVERLLAGRRRVAEDRSKYPPK